MITTYFTNIQDEILKLIESAEIEIKIAMSWITNIKIFNRLLDKLEKEIAVELITNNDDINNNLSSLDFQEFIDKGGRLYFMDAKYFMHHKFMIIDNRKVETGSYNFTEIAENINIENVIITDDQATISNYQSEFENLKKYSNIVTVYKRNQISNNYKSNFVKPQVISQENTDSIDYKDYIVIETDAYYFTLKEKDAEDIVKINISDVEKIYEIDDIIKIKHPLEFQLSLNLKNNFIKSIHKTNILKEPIIL